MKELKEYITEGKYDKELEEIIKIVNDKVVEFYANEKTIKGENIYDITIKDKPSSFYGDKAVDEGICQREWVVTENFKRWFDDRFFYTKLFVDFNKFKTKLSLKKNIITDRVKKNVIVFDALDNKLDYMSSKINILIYHTSPYEMVIKVITNNIK